MKKYRILWMLFAVLTCGQTAWAWSGSGTQGEPYLISSNADWNTLATNVNNGTSTYSGKYFALMSDITVSETISSGTPAKMIGTSDDKSFQGVFNGNGHKITLNFNDTRDADFCAPFRYINGATIKYLHVDGTIVKTKGKNAGGFVGKAKGVNYIIGCRSSVDIQFSKDGDVSSGGFIGELRNGGTTNIVNSTFDGKLQGSKAKCWGGFIGWIADGQKVNFTNCLFQPAQIDVKNDDNYTYARYDSGDAPTIDNCYYYQSLGTVQGTNFWSVANNSSTWDYYEHREYLGDAWKVIGGSGVEWELIPYMSLRSFSGGDGSAESPYQIANRDDWESLAINVLLEQNYSGKHFKLTNDITISTMGDIRFYMVGSRVKINSSTTQERNFEGTFDGDGKTLSFDFRSRDWDNFSNYLPFPQENCAPFRYIKNATIKDLQLAGSILASQKCAASLVAQAAGNNTITNCRSSVNISGTNPVLNFEANHGGFVARVQSGSTTIEGCLFEGQLCQQSGSNLYQCGGFVGSSYGTVTVSNSLFYPTSATVQTSATFVNNSSNVTINNCFYSQALNTVQGKQPRSITAITGINMAPANTATVYDVSGITSYGTGFKYNDVLYAGKNDAVSLNLSIADGYMLTGNFTATNGTVNGSTNPYTLTLSSSNTGDVTIGGDIVMNPWEGTGTEANPFKIKTTADLDALATQVNNGYSYQGYYFKLMNDLEYSYSREWNANDFVENNFTPIGKYGQPFRHFCGHFDGDGHTISGIRCVKLTSDSSSSYMGIFGIVGPGGEVKGIKLTDSRFTGYDHVGGIAGFNCYGIITDCHVTSTVSIHAQQKTASHGGIVGYNGKYNSTVTGTGGEGEGVVSRCTSAATITYTWNADDPYTIRYGGIAGTNDNGHTLKDNLVIGATVESIYNTGAIVGYNAATLINNYYTACTINGTANATNKGANGADVTDNDGAVSALRDNANNNDAINLMDAAASKLGTYNVNLVDRTLYKDGKWNTLCLPFNVTIADSPLAGATVMELDIEGKYIEDNGQWTLDNVNGTVQTGFDEDTRVLSLFFKEATTITAGTPYLIKWANGENIVNPVFEGVTVSKDIHNTGNLSKKVLFSGTYQSNAINSENKNILFMGGNNTLYYPESGATIGAFRAVFTIISDFSVKSFVLNFGDDTETGIFDVRSKTEEVRGGDTIYNLAGQRLQKAQRGVNIINGKKVIIK